MKLLNKIRSSKKGKEKKLWKLNPMLTGIKERQFLDTEKLGLSDKNKYVPIYIGDDVTDEDAFESIHDFGIGILVGSHGKSTAAKFRLKNVYQVQDFS